MGGSYEDITSPDQMVNVNPMTGDMTQMLQQVFGSGSSGAQSIINQMLSGGESNSFLNVLSDPRLSEALGNYSDQRNQLAVNAAQQAQQQIAGQYAGTGLYSGSFGQAVGQGVGQAYEQAASDIAGQQLGLYQNAMGLSAQSQNQGLSSALGYYGGLQGAALSGLTSYGAPNYYEPTLAYQPGLMDYLGMGMSTATSGAGILKLLGIV